MIDDKTGKVGGTCPEPYCDGEAGHDVARRPHGLRAAIRGAELEKQVSLLEAALVNSDAGMPTLRAQHQTACDERDEARRNEALRAQERDDAAERAAAAKERSEYWWTQYHDARRELAEMTKRAEAAEEADTDLLRRCEVGENQLAREQERGQFDYEQAEKARGERDDARNEIASVTAERDALRLGQKVVAERQREACAKTCELIRPGTRGNHEQQEALDNWKTAARFVRETPLVTDAPAAERELDVDHLAARVERGEVVP